MVSEKFIKYLIFANVANIANPIGFQFHKKKIENIQ
jgi:hypothetical protein